MSWYLYLTPVIPYVFLILFLVLLIIAMYIKIKYRFWTLQPVYHVYDFHYFFYRYGVIMKELPEKNKYCNFYQIKTLEFSKVNDQTMTSFVNLIRNHFLKNGENMYIPTKENIVPYLIGHNAPCFLSYYQEPNYLYDAKQATTLIDDKIIAVMTTRPLHIYFNKPSYKTNFDLYYVDHLCVDSNYRKKGIAPQIIQTHEYNQRYFNKSISVSLFKRENELTGIVPLCVYNTYGFSMEKWCVPSDLPGGSSLELVECGPTNIHHLVDFLKLNLENKYEVCITPEISNILELIKTKNIYVYMIIQDNLVISCYYFRDASVSIKKGTMALVCFASVNCCKDAAIFIHGFKLALSKITLSRVKEENKFGYALIEDLSDNGVIIQNIKMKTAAMMVSPTAYFLYNYIYPSVPSNKVFILN
jgi:predicted GNAT family acetyltransferase